MILLSYSLFSYYLLLHSASLSPFSSSSILIYIQKPAYNFKPQYSARTLRMKKVPDKSEGKSFYWMKYFTRGRLWVWTFSSWSDDAPWAPTWKPPSSFRQTALQPSPRNLSRFLLFSYGRGQKKLVDIELSSYYSHQPLTDGTGHLLFVFRFGLRRRQCYVKPIKAIAI